MMHPDPIWMKAFLAVHVTAGILSFVLAPVALATAKGGKQHRRWGMVYLWSMAVVSSTALPMALFRPVLFLALVSVLSSYLAFSGYRVLKLKNLAQEGAARPVDWLAAGFAFLASAALVAVGWLHPSAVQNMQVVAIVFGFLGIRGTLTDMYLFVRKPADKMFWWYSHLTKIHRQLRCGLDGVLHCYPESYLSPRRHYSLALARRSRLACHPADHGLLQA